MEDNSGGAVVNGSDGNPLKAVAPAVKKSGDRKVFTVKLRPGETTYVSWKKLVKDANRTNGLPAANIMTSAPDLPSNAHPNLQSRIAPGQAGEKEAKDEQHPNRFSAVIEKIERLYMGKDSSDEEELDEIPDDDQYDTEDSFIDDAELDEYFEVDNSAIKHDGFFINRGKLERVNEPSVIPNQQPKKRRRKDTAKPPGESDDGHVSNKHATGVMTTTGRSVPSLGKNNSNYPQNLTSLNEQSGNVKAQNQLSVSGVSSKKKSSDTKLPPDPLSYMKVSNGDTSVTLEDVKDTEKSKFQMLTKNVVTKKLKDASGPSDVLHQKYHDKNAYVPSKSQHGKLSNFDELEQSVRLGGKNGNRELPDVNISDGRYAMHMAKSSHLQKKDGSSLRPKSSMLEKAIRELEKIVAESRPPAIENQEADNSSQGIKRRLPTEIKLKLAKVARVAAIQGKVSKELLTRLMSILGHLIQLRTLKRNLKVMINMGLSAKQEKDDRIQEIKKEIVDMIKTRAPSLESKALEQQAGTSDDFQEIGPEERAVKRKFSMDTSLEEKICDIYDIYVNGLDEDAGPQIRKLYVELAQLWPNGLMDNHGIKRAICRVKERQRAMFNRHKKGQEKIKRRKLLAPRMEDGVASSAQTQQTWERLSTDSGSNVLPSANKSMASAPAAAAVQTPSSLTNSLSLDRLKQEKLKGVSSNTISKDEVRVADGSLPRKKVKRKPEIELGEAHFHPERLSLLQGDDRHKSMKQAVNLPPKPNLSGAGTSFEQSS